MAIVVGMFAAWAVCSMALAVGLARRVRGLAERVAELEDQAQMELEERQAAWRREQRERKARNIHLDGNVPMFVVKRRGVMFNFCMN